MNGIAEISKADNFVKALINSFPFGLLVVDSQGYVRVVNNILERALKINTREIRGCGELQ